jgi:hypothetical protein
MEEGFLMAEDIRNVALVDKLYAVAAAVNEYLESSFSMSSRFMIPAQTYWHCAGGGIEEIGHSVLEMFVRSFERQGARGEVVVKEIREFDDLLKKSETPLAKQILRSLGSTWHGFNSENQGQVSMLAYYFGEALPAQLYWWLSGADRDALTKLIEKENA